MCAGRWPPEAFEAEGTRSLPLEAGQVGSLGGERGIWLPLLCSCLWGLSARLRISLNRTSHFLNQPLPAPVTSCSDAWPGAVPKPFAGQRLLGLGA